MIVGIDLGTTNSLISYLTEHGPAIIPLGDGERMLPSTIAQDDQGCTLVGRAARERLSFAPESGAARFKTSMGTQRLYSIGGDQFNAPTLSSLILSRLKAAAEVHLGAVVTDAVITVPAYFRESQRAATVEAGNLAGFNVRRIVNEPTAAAIAHGLHLGSADRRIMVVDLGGGTFDVSVLNIFEGVAEVIATSGDTQLGGEDFTDNLAVALLEYLGAVKLQQSDAGTFARFRARCEQAKLELTTRDPVSVALGDLPFADPVAGQALPISREYFEGVNDRLVQRMAQCIRDALRQSGSTPSDIGEVIAVGGASRMQCVTRLVLGQLGRAPQSRLDPDEAVALGAAVQAGLIEGHSAVAEFVVTDITPFSLGIRVIREGSTNDRYFAPVIHRGETIPISRTQPFSTVHPRQKHVRIEVFQGDRRFVDENEFLGEITVACPPLSADERENRQVDVRFTQDLNGLLEVEATVTATGEQASVIIERGQGRMDEAARRSAIRALQRLKLHPRELLPNRYLIEKANRLYGSLPRQQKEFLDIRLFDFEKALDAQDPEQMRLARQELERALKFIEAS
jgi:molecular chaperone HscC